MDMNRLRPRTNGGFTPCGASFFPRSQYGGMVGFDMWVLRPRVVREYRYWDDTVKESGAYFLAVADAVEVIHANPTLWQVLAAWPARSQ